MPTVKLVKASTYSTKSHNYKNGIEAHVDAEEAEYLKSTGYFEVLTDDKNTSESNENDKSKAVTDEDTEPVEESKTKKVTPRAKSATPKK